MNCAFLNEAEDRVYVEQIRTVSVIDFSWMF